MLHKKKRPKLSKEEAIIAMERFCAYQERSHQEVRTRLIEHQVYGHILEEVLAHLIEQDFLNEERFARAYARGKFRMKQWGRDKILSELKLRKISSYCIKKAFTEIDEESYQKTIQDVLERKYQSIKASKNIYEIKQHLTRYGRQKGYEFQYIQSYLNNIPNE